MKIRQQYNTYGDVYWHDFHVESHYYGRVCSKAGSRLNVMCVMHEG